MNVGSALIHARLATRDPALLWSGGPDVAVLRTSPLGFADAPETDRVRWLSGFKRVLDGLDSKLQVVIEVVPGSVGEMQASAAAPADFDEMHAADLSFVDDLAAMTTTSRRSALLAIDVNHAPRLESALHEAGVEFTRESARDGAVFGKELANELLTHDGCTRTWSVERLPGLELEPGWLFRLLPAGLRLTLSW
ncbi:MAG TPA: hypothetical protein VKQ30_03270, partial [Ktedonobacterales bacterium]|nr:hypothetical protein [Ktedonobacterales bacterium]